MKSIIQMRTGERGSAVIEFALVIGFLLMLAGGMFEFGRIIWFYDALTKATRDGARIMSVANFGDIGAEVTKAQAAVVATASAARLRGNHSFANGDVLVSCDNDLLAGGELDCTGFSVASPPARVIVAINSSFLVNIGNILPLFHSDLTRWSSFDKSILAKTSMPYLK